MNSKLKYLIVNIIWYNIKRLLRYPFKIKNQYGFYNAILSYILGKTKSENLLNLRKRNVYFINTFIILTIFLGFLFTGISIFNNKAKYHEYIQRATLPIGGETYFEKTKNSIRRGYKMIVFQPISKEEIQYLIYGFLLSIIGGRFLALNPIFKESKKIEDILSKIRKVDADEKPWRVVWTPDAIYFESFLGDPDSFINDRRFWNEINFTPDPPKIDPKDRKKFIVPRKYELPPKIIFKVRQDHLFDEKD